MRFPGTSIGLHTLERNDRGVHAYAADTLARRAITPMNERKHVYGVTQENGRDAHWPENTKKRVTLHMNCESYSVVIYYKLGCKLITI